MGGHNRAKFKDDFCAVAAQPSCGSSINADYVAVCRPNWPDHAFVRKIKGNPNPPPKSFEAHHILCAASVGVMIVDAGGKGVGKLVGDTEWCSLSGLGTIYSVSVTRRAGPIAYAIAYVALDEGITLLTNIVDCDFDDLKIGQRVEVTFKPAEGGAMVPMFKPA